MNTIGRFFLRAKHWQIFLLLVGVFGFGEVVAIFVMVAIESSTGKVGTAVSCGEF
jgi:hypothetical protein